MMIKIRSLLPLSPQMTTLSHKLFKTQIGIWNIHKIRITMQTQLKTQTKISPSIKGRRTYQSSPLEALMDLA